jgi:predicted DNA binding CopG/RHH family protein
VEELRGISRQAQGKVQGCLWRKLSDNQRLLLMNKTAPPAQRVHQSHAITACKALIRLGLAQEDGYHWWLQPEAEALAAWAREHGCAQWDGAGWKFSAPEVARQGRIDPEHLADLVAAGLHGAEIARRLGVSRQGVAVAAERQGLTLAPLAKKPKRPKLNRVPRTKHLTFMVSEGELAAIRNASANDGITVSAWIREIIQREMETVAAFELLSTTDG